jgi:23S rRNA (adenine2503-C2)-methyltransferase
VLPLHDRQGLAARLRVLRRDPLAADLFARLVLREGVPPAEAAGRRGVELPSELVAELEERLVLVAREDSAEDGASRLLWRTPSGARFESVVLRAASGRRTLCVSVQARCPIGCAFCASGTRGPAASLSTDEVLEQVVRARRLVASEGARLRNLVFMGMGEPLLVEELLHGCLDALLDPRGFAFGPSRVCVSTVGLPAGMRRLAERFPRVRQALSLHAARPEVRERLIPTSRASGPAALREAVREVGARTGERVLVEVLLLEGVNDGPEDERALAAWLEGLPVRLNLIPYNRPGAAPADGTLDLALAPSPPQRVAAWADAFRARGVETTVRRSLGRDVAAACGQLAAGAGADGAGPA